MQRSFHYDVPVWKITWLLNGCHGCAHGDSTVTSQWQIVSLKMPCTHTQSKNKPIYHCWPNYIHLILMVVKMVNILCFDFVILFAGINAFLSVYKQNKQNGSSFIVNGCRSRFAQLILPGSALISLDKMQMGSAEILGSADPARIRSANSLW